MASGVIDGFFRKVRPGQPLRSLANIENLNKVANILNDITGEGCWIEKPLNGDPWIVHISDDTSGEEPFMRRRTYDCQVNAVNQAYYDASMDRVRPQGVTIYVNGIAVQPFLYAFENQKLSWAKSAGVKTIRIWQSYYYHQQDADGQYIGNPAYYWSCTDAGYMAMSGANVATIPWCRVEIPVVGEPPVIKCLLEGPLNIYCYRGDSYQRSYATYYYASALGAIIQTSKTTDDEYLPLKVRNLSAAADGYYNAYPEGRYKIEDGEVVWLEPHEPEQTKNDSKLLLLRYLWPQGGTPHGQPYWRTVAQFLTNAESWVEDYVSQEFGGDDRAWLIALLSPWAWEIWSENPGPYQPVLESDIEEGVEVLAAVMGKNGQWHSVVDIVAMQDELDVALDDYDEIYDRVESVEGQAQTCVDEGDAASDDADAAEQTIQNFVDFSAQADLVSYEANDKTGHTGQLIQDFDALNTRITALEQQVGGA